MRPACKYLSLVHLFRLPSHRIQPRSKQDEQAPHKLLPALPPAISVLAGGVIFGHLTLHAHTQNFFQALFSAQWSMRIAQLARGDREALFPLGEKAHYSRDKRWDGYQRESHDAGQGWQE